jgi:hypothetical protein
MGKNGKPDFVARGARPLADIIGAALGPACRRRGFSTLDLISHWPDVVGPAFADCTAPDKLSWPRRPAGLVEEENHEPALLTVRCTGAAALRLSHEAGLVVERINTFFGYRLVGRIRVLQLPPVRLDRPRKVKPAPLPPEVEAKVRVSAAGIVETPLREAVERLGRAVAGESRSPGRR